MPADALFEILAEGKYMRFVRKGHWEFAERNQALGAVVIVAVTPENELVLVQQHRIPVGADVIELPAGLVGDVPGEPTHDWGLQARRELLEETGFHARRVEPLTRGPVSAGFGSEVVDFYLATGLDRKHDGGGVEHENIVVHLVPLDKVPAWLKRKQRQGLLVDPKIFAGLYFAQQAKKAATPTRRGDHAAKPRRPAKRSPGRPSRGS